MEDIEDNSYVIFAQANVWKSPNACNELGYYINKLMSCYKYDGPDQAGLVVNRMPEPDTNYRTRLGNVGIQINDSDRVISGHRSRIGKSIKHLIRGTRLRQLDVIHR